MLLLGGISGFMSLIKSCAPKEVKQGVLATAEGVPNGSPSPHTFQIFFKVLYGLGTAWKNPQQSQQSDRVLNGLFHLDPQLQVASQPKNCVWKTDLSQESSIASSEGLHQPINLSGFGFQAMVKQSGWFFASYPLQEKEQMEMSFY